MDARKRLTHEFEPKAAGRPRGAPVSTPNPTSYKNVGDPSTAVRAWVKGIEDYEKQSRDKVADTIKTSVLITHLVDADVAEPLKLNASPLNTFDNVLVVGTFVLLAVCC